MDDQSKAVTKNVVWVLRHPAVNLYWEQCLFNLVNSLKFAPYPVSLSSENSSTTTEDKSLANIERRADKSHDPHELISEGTGRLNHAQSEHYHPCYRGQEDMQVDGEGLGCALFVEQEGGCVRVRNQS